MKSDYSFMDFLKDKSHMGRFPNWSLYIFFTVLSIKAIWGNVFAIPFILIFVTILLFLAYIFSKRKRKSSDG